MKTQVAIIGSGPGGYVAAIRLAQLGRQVLVIDETPTPGGVCLHRGCIPSKALIHASDTLHTINEDAHSMGISVSKATINPKKLQAWKEDVVDRLTNGISSLFAKHGIAMMNGWASFSSSKTLKVSKPDKSIETVEFEDCIIGAGSKEEELKGFPFDGKRIIGSTDSLLLDYIPGHIAIIGGGYIGSELGITYAKIGSKVTIVEFFPNILGRIEPELVPVVETSMKAMGISILTNTEAKGFRFSKKAGQEQISNRKHNSPTSKTGPVILTVQTKGNPHLLEISCDVILVAVGRKPHTDNLGLENTTAVRDKHGFILHNKQQRTDDPHIFVIGDAAGEPMLAHKASAEGIVAAEAIAGMPSAFDHLVVPCAIYTDPEVATVGLTADEAKKKGIDIIVGKFPFSASGRALTTNSNQGFISLVAEKASKRLLGCHIVGPHASDLISEAALAIEMGATLEDISLTIHPHPTLPESLMEAANAALGKVINIYQPKDNK